MSNIARKAMKIETLAVHGGYSPTRPPRPSPCRSTRPPPTPSTAPSTAPTCSTSRCRQHLHPHHEPDAGRAGKARRRDGRRHCRRWPGLRHGGDHLRDPDHRRSRRQHRLGSTRSTAAPTTCSPTPCRNTASRCALPTTAIRPSLRKADRRKTKAVFCESVGNPLGNVTDFERWPKSPTARRAADRRQHRALALPVPPVRARRRHRRALADQVPRRPRQQRSAASSSIAASSPGPSTRPSSSASTSRTCPTTASSTPKPSARPPTSAAPASCRCATWARRSRRSTPS
jgi:hypothetical protein